ncbi:MAG: Ppx/GppA family phosphatase [Rhodobiaceae bacterium]|nr:Ppx/GppA family phosphatase [Rhodobiaceae bacterium]
MLPGLSPVGVIDIGSNSVRLVVYEGLNRSPSPFYNEKVLCELGDHIAETGRMSEEHILQALAALRRFRILCEHVGCETVYIFATAAARDAENGEEFVARAEEVCGVPVNVLAGEEEARLTGLGIVSGFHKPSGLAGDLGGGSLEFVRIRDHTVDCLSSHKLGALRLRDESEGKCEKARAIVSEVLDRVDLPELGRRPFYAIGGTWRAFAKAHMATIDYPLHVVHGYRIKAKHAIALARQMQRPDIGHLTGTIDVSRQRAALLPYGAVILEEILKRTKARTMLVSALGVREGLLFTKLDEATRRQDPLLSAARELAILRSRSPEHGRELCEWTDELFALIEPDETEEMRRVRHAACWLTDIGWRAHPDYRGEQSLNIIANAAFTGVTHQGRAIIALSVFYRHAGLGEEEPGQGLRHLVDLDGMRRAALIGAALRLAHRISASMPGLLPQSHFALDESVLQLALPRDLADLTSNKIDSPLRRLAELAGCTSDVAVTD